MIRPATPADEVFVTSGWSASYRMSRDVAFVQMSDYADHMHKVIAAVLARPRVKVLVSEGEVLRGFLVYEESDIGNPPLVIYIFVAQPYRKRGIARELFAAANIDPSKPFEYAARTRTSWELSRKTPLARYNPYRARFAEEMRST